MGWKTIKNIEIIGASSNSSVDLSDPEAVVQHIKRHRDDPEDDAWLDRKRGRDSYDIYDSKEHKTIEVGWSRYVDRIHRTYHNPSSSSFTDHDDTVLEDPHPMDHPKCPTCGALEGHVHETKGHLKNRAKIGPDAERAMDAWRGSGMWSSSTYGIRDAADAILHGKKPANEVAGKHANALLDAIKEHGKPAPYELHRGQSSVDLEDKELSVDEIADKYKVGTSVHFPLASFCPSGTPGIMGVDRYMRNAWPFERRPGIMFHAPKGTHALDVTGGEHPDDVNDLEHMVSGHFDVTDQKTQGDIVHVFITPKQKTAAKSLYEVCPECEGSGEPCPDCEGSGITPTHIKIQNEAGDDWECPCGNVPSDYGFYPCDEKTGDERTFEEQGGWDGIHFRCDKCGRIIDQNTGRIKGKAFNLKREASVNKRQLDIPTSPHFDAVMSKLHTKGHKALIVGGAVRDALLGEQPKDVDVEVYGTSFDELSHTLSQHGKVNLVGKAFGVVKFTDPDKNEYDFSLPRRDNKTGVGHKDFETEFDPDITPQEAASRRDFTFNSLAYDPISKELHDYHGGEEDLKNKVIRHTSDQFAEDPLRVLRGMQFSARYGMDVHPDTAKLAQSISHEYSTLPKERVGEEFMKLATKGKEPGRAIDYLQKTGWHENFPALHGLHGLAQDPEWHPEGDVATHTAHAMNAAAKIADREGLKGDDRAVTVFGAMCHDLGKATHTQTDGPRITSHGHDSAGGPIAKGFLNDIGIKPDIIGKVVPLVENHMQHLNYEDGISHRTVRRLAERLHPATIKELSHVMEADHSGRPPLPGGMPKGAQNMLDKAAESNVTTHKQERLIEGRDVMPFFNNEPGPHIGEHVKAAYEAQLNGEINTKEEGQAWLKKRLGKTAHRYHYHVSDADNEESIKERGLDYRQGVSPWPEGMVKKPGNYLFQTEDEAQEYIDTDLDDPDEERFPSGQDWHIWKVDTKSYKVHVDPEEADWGMSTDEKKHSPNGRHVVYEPIKPEHLKKQESGFDYDAWLRYEEQHKKGSLPPEITALSEHRKTCKECGIVELCPEGDKLEQAAQEATALKLQQEIEKKGSAKLSMAILQPEEYPDKLRDTIDEFRKLPNVHRLEDPDEAHLRCGPASSDFANFALQRGHKAEVRNLREESWTPRMKNNQYEHDEYRGRRHQVAYVDKHFVDWTARQYDPTSPVPRVYKNVLDSAEDSRLGEGEGPFTKYHKDRLKPYPRPNEYGLTTDLMQFHPDAPEYDERYRDPDAVRCKKHGDEACFKMPEGHIPTKTCKCYEQMTKDEWGNEVYKHVPPATYHPKCPVHAGEAATKAWFSKHKTSARELQTYYHLSHPDNRDSIREHGLRGNRVYLVEDPELVPFVDYKHPDNDADIWEVRADDKRVYDDEENENEKCEQCEGKPLSDISGSCFTKGHVGMWFRHEGPIGPENVRLHTKLEKQASWKDVRNIKVAGKTNTFELGKAKEWEDIFGPDQSEIVHTFDDGWTIRKLKTVGDRDREGRLQSNCWSHTRQEPGGHYLGETQLPFLPIDKWKEDFKEPAPMPSYSLRDPDNMPHASFYHAEPNSPDHPGNIPVGRGTDGLETHGDFPIMHPLIDADKSTDKGVTWDVLGKHNSEPHYRYTNRIHEWHQSLDYDVTLGRGTGNMRRFQQKTAAWKDVRNKAVRLRNANLVDITRLDDDVIAADVQGDHGTYQVVLYRQMPGSWAITMWECSCTWGYWSFRRQITFVGRMCSHALATLYTAHSKEYTEPILAHKDSPKKRENALENWAAYGGHERSDSDEFHPLHHMLDEAEPVDVELHRGITVSPGGLQNLKSLEEIGLPISSFSKHERVALDEAQAYGDDHGVVFHLSPGARAVKNTNNRFAEGEYLVRGRFKVDGIEKKGPYIHHVYLTPSAHTEPHHDAVRRTAASKGKLTFYGAGRPITINVEVARDARSIQQGLMNRTYLGPREGMAFIYPYPPSYSGFWMMNTLIPLDIAFWDKEGRIIEIKTMEPCPPGTSNCPVYKCSRPYWAAVEVNKGFFQQWGIRAGDRIELDL